jgi:hypothetical protein
MSAVLVLYILLLLLLLLLLNPILHYRIYKIQPLGSIKSYTTLFYIV